MSAALDESAKAKASAPETAQPTPAPKRRKLRLGEMLVTAGYISDEQIMRALAVQRMGGGRLGSILVKLRFCTEEHIRAVLHEQLGVEVVELGDIEPDDEVLEIIPMHLVRKYEVVPLAKDGDHLTIAMMDPYNLTALDDIKFATGVKLVTVVTCTEDAFTKFLDEKLQTQTVIEEILDGGEFYDRAVSSLAEDSARGGDGEEDDSNEVVHDLTLAGSQPPIITLCNFLLVEAINRRASDIHVEPYETYFRIRMRIDGRLQTLLTPPRRLHSPMIVRFKILAEMDISKRRIPQDGHIAIQYQKETVHYRVSTLPTVYGEKCVIRLLKKDHSLMNLDTIGFGKEELSIVSRMLHMPQGIILVTGPTGSGKTTTLHAGLCHINDPQVNIVTLEDPVEASIDGINHVKVDAVGGVTFATGLKSILRQDPDVVFIGEMRDPEVSGIAVKAALTGHLVLSTLHTNSAAESLTRLADMGIPPYLMASSLLMVVAQRLLRRSCAHCSVESKLSDEEIAEFHLTPEQIAGATMTKGSGCPSCNDTGFRGRLAVYEILAVDVAMRELIREGAGPSQIVAHAREHSGMLTLFEAGIRAALKGESTLDEVRRVCAGSM